MPDRSKVYDDWNMNEYIWYHLTTNARVSHNALFEAVLVNSKVPFLQRTYEKLQGDESTSSSEAMETDKPISSVVKGKHPKRILK